MDGADGCYNNCTVNPLFTCVSDAGLISNCTPICGDGRLIGAELNSGRCDDKNNISGDGCSSTCVIEKLYSCWGTPSKCNITCGNGKLDTYAGESCDNNLTTVDGSDGCFNNCTINPLYICTTPVNSSSVCTSVCGDGRLSDAEVAAGTCDDRNKVSGDGCSAECQV